MIKTLEFKASISVEFLRSIPHFNFEAIFHLKLECLPKRGKSSILSMIEKQKIPCVFFVINFT